MILIELKRLIKEALILVLVLTAIMVYITTGNSDPMIPSGIMEVILLLYASFTGWSMFDRENQDNALEYLLTMPVSRTRLFILKTIPRFFFVAIAFGIYMLLHQLFEFPVFLPQLQFSVIYVSFFLVALSFSLTIRSYIGALFMTIFFSIGLMWFIKMTDPDINDITATLIANIVLLSFPIIFYLVFRTFDIRPIGTFNKKLLPPLLAIFLITSGFFWLRHQPSWWGYYLTNEGQIIRASCSMQRGQLLQDNPGSTPIPLAGSAWPLVETEDQLLIQIRTRSQTHCKTRHINRIDPKTGRETFIWNLPDGFSMNHNLYGANGRIIENHYYNLIYNYEEKIYKIIILPLNHPHPRPKEISLYGPMQGHIYYLFHISQEPLGFFLAGKNHLYWANEDGEIHPFHDSFQNMTAWKNNLLVFSSDKMTLYEYNGQLKPVMVKEGIVRKINNRHKGFTSKKVLVRTGKKLRLFDLETREFQPTPLKTAPKYYHFSGKNDQTLHLLWIKLDNLTYGTFENGQLTIKKRGTVHLTGDYDTTVSPAGAVFYNDKEYQVFKFD
jgi:hypothetical protein